MTPLRGFTLIEIVIVLAILGTAMFLAFPGISNSMEVRALDNVAGEIVMAMETAKWQAAATSLDHRLRFAQEDGAWTFRLEKETTPGTWVLIAGGGPKRIAAKFPFTANLPAGLAVAFEATGFVSGYDSARNSVAVESPKLQRLGQAYRRTVRFLAGGSVQVLKS